MHGMPRPKIDETLLRIAGLYAWHSTCSRANVGAVVSIDGRVVSSGYNGAPSGMDHCQHPIEETFAGIASVMDNVISPARSACARAVHAEANAIAFAARNGVKIFGGTLYTTVTPCVPCAQLLINAGIIRVVAAARYRDQSGVDLLHDACVPVVIMDDVVM